ncbi:hypothetical protein OG455_41875 [Kitasatospora sp. NBC_01287]|uniref:hypothetical protein n=1 Tax=Kitasatospora sp. NBC_01287 TaxID=2903573 RepID=UPI00224CAD3D|nr:hypothetical protein [Kitasatospora sp. NBC_01287]MCX4751714.1 hypothetical protein [Kitasatospora sp. NBC_01287]MCX4751994.1 hypothetical protein [Kitasatospora sp. NBC_01287]
MTITSEAGASAPAGRRRTTKPAPVGEERIPKPSQGWYRDPVTGTRLRRVTTILEQGCAKGDALTMWAGNITADTAMDNLPRLVAASLRPDERAQITAWLKRAHIRKKDERADIGSAVHRLIEAHVLGQPMPEELVESPELNPYLRHFTRFVDEWQVTFEASEMVVGSLQQGYAGTLDYLLRSPVLAAHFEVAADTVFMGDTKTGGELDVRGVYPEAGLQMAAYRNAAVCWLRDGSKVEMPPTHSMGVVLHLRPEGYRLVPVRCDHEVFKAFLVIQRAAEWTSGLSKKVVGSALALPALTEKKAA